MLQYFNENLGDIELHGLRLFTTVDPVTHILYFLPYFLMQYNFLLNIVDGVFLEIKVNHAPLVVISRCSEY